MTQHSKDPIKNIVIVGGGTAGWMTAAALSRLLNCKTTSITLIESDEISTIGVGEATIPPIVNFNKILGINENEFVAKTQATFKLGIKFEDWHKLNTSYLHPFGEYGMAMQGVAFHQLWLKYRNHKGVGSLDEYCLSAMAALKGKFLSPGPDPHAILSTISYAYHFDAALYAKFLRSAAESQNTKRIEGKVKQVVQDSQTGFIEKVVLDNGYYIAGDLFIDCTGFRGLLIEGALKTGYDDWSDILPCDRAIAIQTKSDTRPPPYTISTARQCGWQWRIPLQHRNGNGLVYSSQHISDSAASDILLSNLDEPTVSSPLTIKFTTGKRKKAWNKNCVAIGLSAGFIEPLESTSIHLIQSGISRLIALFPDTQFRPVEIDEYNRQTDLQYLQIRDFILLHYIATQRDDSDFWNDIKSIPLPDSLQQKVDLFSNKGKIVRHDKELFAETNWLAVFLGQGIFPATWDPFADAMPEEETLKAIKSLRAAIADLSNKLPTHQQYIDRYCRANSF
ncbi:tryptophan halogenase family protein [Hirschia litorea]|uniref:Tryptophan halogenase family protein n=1 Tax=Hirschia litorea TaxID=1199156 RepID=A0ABW2INV2_9PROT